MSDAQRKDPHNRSTQPKEEEDDPVDSMLKKAGCLDLHYNVQACMVEHKDWRKCKTEVQEFKECIERSKRKA